MTYYYLPDNFVSWVYNNFNKFIIFETRKFDEQNIYSYIFTNPVDIIQFNNSDNITRSFEKIENVLSKKLYVAGYFSYKLGYYLDYFEKDNLFNKNNAELPLMFLYVFKPPIIFDHTNNKFINLKSDSYLTTNQKPANFNIFNHKINISKKEYVTKINKIKSYIAQGDTYQVNFTIKSKFRFSGNPLGLYYRLCKTQKVAYTSFIKTPEFNILSFSPELFIRKTGNVIITKPMKGTIQRGINVSDDNKNRYSLFKSKKNRAENVMIVDLLRNDLARVSKYGDVYVKKLFEVEKFETLFQMTSTICTKTNPDINIYKLFNSIFPSGSVTGAPKIRTMQIIKELESDPRGVYTGAIGFITPEKDILLNVSIRTAVIKKNIGELGIGSGIVWDSEAEKEFEECKLKSLFLLKKPKKFKIIETVLWRKYFIKYNNDVNSHGYFLLKYHIDRIKKSAQYFDFHFSEQKMLDYLVKLKFRLLKTNQDYYRVRILLSTDGKFYVTHKVTNKLSKTGSIQKIVLSKYTADIKNVFLYHKTTQRRYYNLGYFDVLFSNNIGQITETSRGNIFIKSGKYYYTPPIKCGLLPGVYREYFIKTSKNVIEKPLLLKDLVNADKVFVTNSVIGLKQVELG